MELGVALALVLIASACPAAALVAATATAAQYGFVGFCARPCVAYIGVCSRSITDADWEILFKTNVLGYARCIKHALAHMRNNEPSDYIIENDQGQGIQVCSVCVLVHQLTARFCSTEVCWMVFLVLAVRLR